MTYMAGMLNQRGDIQRAVMAAATGGKLLRTYTTITTIWCTLNPLKDNIMIRYQEIGQNITHECTVRKSAIDELGSGFTAGFSSGLKVNSDIYMVKSDYYFFVKDRTSTAGRLFQIKGMRLDEQNQEFIKLLLMHIEEQNTGATP